MVANVMRKPTYDSSEAPRNISAFQFRNLHPKILMGTASDRYAGWMDQIYTRERYEGRISRRAKTIKAAKGIPSYSATSNSAMPVE